MEKETVQKTLSIFEELKIDRYMICIGGDNNRMFNSETSLVYDTGSEIIIFQISDKVGNLVDNSVFDYAVLDYGNISNIKAMHLTYEQGIELMNKLGYSSDERLLDMLKSNKPRTNNNPGVGGNLRLYTEEVPVLDDNGEPVLDENNKPVTKTEVVLPKGMNHYIV